MHKLVHALLDHTQNVRDALADFRYRLFGISTAEVQTEINLLWEALREERAKRASEWAALDAVLRLMVDPEFAQTITDAVQNAEVPR